MTAKRWVQRLSTLIAIGVFVAMSWVLLSGADGRLGYGLLAVLVVCSFAYKWATRPS